MATTFLRSLRRASRTCTLHFSPSNPHYFRSISRHSQSIISSSQASVSYNPWKPSWGFRNLNHGTVNLVISQGKPKFETHEIEPPKKEKWKTKKKLKMQRKREKTMRKRANKRDPRCIRVKGKKKKQKFRNAEERIKNNLEKARIKEALLIERLKKYEVPKQQGPMPEPVKLTGEERFYMKKMAQKGSNYVPVGRRGVFGGVILNMHLHWKKHETVKVFCKPCKPGQVHEYAREIARLSGGIPIHIIGDDTIIFYRGKNYVQPEVMSPIDTLSKKKALEKSKYEQSLESVRHFIAISEKELELYYRHVALYGDPSSCSSNAISISTRKEMMKVKSVSSNNDGFSKDPSDTEFESTDDESVDTSKDPSNTEFESTDYESIDTDDDAEDEDLSGNEFDLHDESLSDTEVDSDDEVSFSVAESSASSSDSSSMTSSRYNFCSQDSPADRLMNS